MCITFCLLRLSLSQNRHSCSQNLHFLLQSFIFCVSFLLFSLYFKFLALVFLNFVFMLRYWNMVVEYGFLMSLIYAFWWFLLGYMCFTLRTYVMILCNWLILWQNALYLYLGRFRMCLNTSRNHVSRSSIETFKSVQEIKLIVQIL